jgi:hypothetical protein
MGQYFQVNGDYNIKCKDGGTIVLNPGPTGDVNIVGNLTVAGAVTSVASSNIEITDRIIVLNKGEDSASTGVTYQYSGVEINRGAAPSAALVWNEDTTDGFSSGYWMVATGTGDLTPGVAATYTFNNSNLKLKRILTDASEDSGDLILIGTGTGVVKVAGTTNYRLQVTDNDDIPNKDYVDYSILNNPTFQIRAPQGQDTRLIIADKDITPNLSSEAGSLAYFANQTGIPSGADSRVSVFVDGDLSATFFADRFSVFGFDISNGTITNSGSTNDNIYVQTNGTGKLQTNYALQLDYPGATPGSVNGSHVIYSGIESTGDSGLYFATINNRDELVSKNRALLFSMIF